MERKGMRLSPSRIETHRRCPMRYWWENVAALPRTQTDAHLRGEAVHKLIERYLLTGQLPDAKADGKLLTDIFNAFLPLLPTPPIPANQIEQWVNFRLPGWPVMSGRVDLHIPPSFPLGGLNEADVEGEDLSKLPLAMFQQVIDWKTTSNLRYAKTSEDLEYDAQSVIYSAAYARAWPLVDFCLVYGQTRKPHYTQSVHVRFRRSDLATRLATLYEGEVRLMIDTYNIGEPNKVRYNLAACGDYTGCEYLDYCAVVGVPIYGGYSPRKSK